MCEYLLYTCFSGFSLDCHFISPICWSNLLVAIKIVELIHYDLSRFNLIPHQLELFRWLINCWKLYNYTSKLENLQLVWDLVMVKLALNWSQKGNYMSSLEVIYDYYSIKFIFFQRLSYSPKRDWQKRELYLKVY